MKKFDYNSIQNWAFDLETVQLLAKIAEFRGKQELYMKQKPESLATLEMIARIQSIDASNRIEGIQTTEKRLQALMSAESTPQNRDEAEIAGYRDALALIHDAHADMPLNVNSILGLHNIVYRYEPNNFAGKFKNVDNVITEVRSNGETFVRFQPAPAFLTPQLVEDLVEAYRQVISDGRVDPLLVMPCFVLDFVSIHPFRDGNGRMSRLLTLLLLYEAGYLVGKYVSIEKIIEETKINYYEALRQSSVDWWENKQNYKPFFKYMLQVVFRAYADFESRFGLACEESLTPTERIKLLLQSEVVPMTKKAIRIKLPDISQKTIERTLWGLMSSGEVMKLGQGRSTTYKLV
jgi:Fic family protein